MPDITIAGMIFDLEPRFSEGHVCSVAEANALNSAMRESVRNNFAPKVKAAREGGLGEDIIRQMYADYLERFSFSATVANRQPLNKIKQKAEEIALARVRIILERNGHKIEDFDEHKVEVMVQRLLEKQPDIMAEAERQITLMKTQAAAALGFDLIEAGDDE